MDPSQEFGMTNPVGLENIGVDNKQKKPLPHQKAHLKR